MVSNIAKVFLISLALNASVLARIAEFPPSVSEGSLSMTRVGYGEFHFARIIDIYAAALYLPTTVTGLDAADPLTAKRLDLFYYRDVPRERIVTAAETVLKRQYSAQRYAALEKELNHWHTNFRDAARGDRFSLVFDGQTLSLRHNNRLIARSESVALTEAYFGIWLGEGAISDALRSQLLDTGRSGERKSS